MLRNIEIKARVHDLEKVLKVAKELSGTSEEVIPQSDVFYNAQFGRLKLRTFQDSSATLVYYDRPDTEGPKLSEFQMFNFSAQDGEKAKSLHSILTKSIGIKGHLNKTRYLFLVGQTRVHVDVVENLGNFMELEVVLTPDQCVKEGQEIAKDLQIKLGVKDEDLLPCAYIDLLLKENSLVAQQ